ncbi:Notchless [Spironucleus salmonicida]|uniref:NLE (NUC135) domain and WD domain, G-beta repeat-containing protein n=1 Tax=Spironucleus salmonicida TaxID=348837 RepID=V6LDC1_9EUKA|nr:Notchless [Spironucleus salmonicida]|eukprot:EST42505.1 NLE (NUC135) domain and WD domain, G-beta repeat-containing protein [Spironucleus salmonicida]
MTSYTCNIFVNDDPMPQLQNLTLPANTTPQDLQMLLNDLTEDSDNQLLYEFYIDAAPIISSLQQLNLNAERQLTITAVPQSAHKVTALSRCSNDLPGHEEAVLALQFSPNSQFLASGSGDTTIRIWDTNSCTPVRILDAHKAWVLALKFSPDSQFLASADFDGVLAVFETANWTQIGGFNVKKSMNRWITSISWQPDSQAFFTGGKDGSVKKWSRNGALLKVVFSASKCVTDVCCGGTHLIVSSEDCKVYIFDLISFRLLHEIRHAHWCNSVQTSQWYLCRFGVFGLLKLFEAFRPEIRKIAPEIKNLADFEALAPEKQLATYLKLLQNRKEMLIVTSDDHTLSIYEIQPDIKFVKKLTGHVKAVAHACFSPDGTAIASVSFDRSVRLWGADGTFLAKFHNHASEVYRVAFSADSRYFITCSKDSTCMLFSVKKRKMIRELPGHADEVYCVDWSLQGELGASAGKDRVVKIWRQ